MTTPLKLDIDEAIERLGMGRFQRRLLLAAGLCIAADTIEVLLLSFLTLVVTKEWDLNHQQASAVTSVVFIGALIGTLVLGPLGDALGRKPLFVFSTTLIAVCGMLTALSTTYWIMMIFQFGVGIGVGGVVIPFDAIAEFIPNEQRGTQLLILGYFWTLGTMAVPILAWLGLKEESSWRLFVVLCSIPCVISTFLTIVFVPESPRWLLTQGKHDQALEILRTAAATNQLDPTETFPEGVTLIDKHEADTEVASVFTLLKPEWRKMTILLWSTWIGLAFLYWGTIQVVTLVFVDESQLKNGDVLTFDYGAIFSSSCAEIVGQTLVILLIHRAGRTKITSLMYLLGGICVFGLCWAASDITTPRSVLVVLAFFARCFAMGASSMTWIVTAELLPTQIRTTGHSAANGVARLGGAISPFLVSPANPIGLIGLVMGVVSILTSVVAWNLPETAGAAIGTAGKRELDPDGKPIQVSEIV
ncbi:Synaptic vesicle 2-related protein [Seminavis robusta]|uniref:Hexose transporter 1 n=1 Tax=Seminavis robusta TaxID=568900 RepID=A0A9N8D762_9STRA|nr:Synaptic vesicle 2-related protein [Seminavis robusta]|eukprot:Sro18_g013010.1 Synaptic vesicle 2-related protein (474) ;mRNA; f:124027-125707